MPFVSLTGHEKDRYIGDKRTKEFHSIRRAKPQCLIARIVNRNAVFFRKGRQAIDQGFDACGHCSIYWKSRRNRK